MEMGNTLRKSLSEVNSSIDTTQGKGWRKLLAFMGPAYLVSVGYMDPGNWATDIAGGSRFGYALIWVLLMSNLMALLLQSLSARLGIVRQLDLAQASRSTYNRGVNFSLWILAEIAIAACDLAEVLGMAIGLQLLFDLPIIMGRKPYGIGYSPPAPSPKLWHSENRSIHHCISRDYRWCIFSRDVLGQARLSGISKGFYSFNP